MKTSNTAKFGRLLIAFLFILIVIMNFENVLLVFQVNTSNSWWKLFLWSIGSLFFLLNIATAFGLLINKKWSFWLAYLAIPLTTIFFSTAYIPFINNFFAENIRYILMMIGNFIVLAFIVYLHTISKSR